MAVVLAVQRSARERLRLDLVRPQTRQPRGRRRQPAEHRDLRRPVLVDRDPRADGTTTAPVRAAGVPGRRGVPADQQGLLTAGRPVAAGAGRAGPSALAGLADLAGL